MSYILTTRLVAVNVMAKIIMHVYSYVYQALKHISLSACQYKSTTDKWEQFHIIFLQAKCVMPNLFLLLKGLHTVVEEAIVVRPGG